MNISGVTGVNVILQTEIDGQNGNFIRGKLISIRQVGYGIPILDESYEGFYLIKDLTSEDIPKSQLLFVGSERIYNSEIITPPIRPMHDFDSIIDFLMAIKNDDAYYKSRETYFFLEGVKIEKPGLKPSQD